jgi:hypothetical protein
MPDETKKAHWPNGYKTLLAPSILTLAVLGTVYAIEWAMHRNARVVDRDNLIVDYKGQLYRLVPVEKKVEYREPLKAEPEKKQ